MGNERSCRTKLILTDTQTHRNTDTQTHRHTGTQTRRHRDTEAQRHRDTETQKHTDRETEKDEIPERPESPSDQKIDVTRRCTSF